MTDQARLQWLRPGMVALASALLLALAAPASAQSGGRPSGGWADEVKRSLDRPDKPADSPQETGNTQPRGGAKPPGGALGAAERGASQKPPR